MPNGLPLVLRVRNTRVHKHTGPATGDDGYYTVDSEDTWRVHFVALQSTIAGNLRCWVFLLAAVFAREHGTSKWAGCGE